jgi:putative ABC transport system permease protein
VERDGEVGGGWGVGDGGWGAAWRGIAGTGATATAVLALVVLGSVFVAVAAPRLDLGMRTRALQHVFGSASATDDSVLATASWSQLASPAGLLSPTEIDTETVALSAGMSGIPVPLAPPSADWSGLTSAQVAVSGAARGADAGAAPQLEIAYRSSLPQHSRLVAGRQPDRAAVHFRPGVPRLATGASPVLAATFQVAVTRPTAARFGLGVGSRLTAGRGITLVVSGVIRPVGPGSAYWTLDPVMARPALNYPQASAPYWAGAAFAGPAEAEDMQLVFGSAGIQVFWDFPLALAHVNADAAGQLTAHLAAAVNQVTAGGNVVGPAEPAPGTIQGSCGLAPRLAAFLQAQAAVQAILSLLLIGLAVIGAAGVLLGGYLLAEHRAREFSVMRARGAAPWQLAAVALRGSAAALPAAAAGLALAITVTPGYDAPQAWWLGGGTALAAVSGPPLIAARRGRAEGRTARRPASGRPARWMPSRRLVVEATLAVAAIGGLDLLHQQGLPPGAGLNPYTGAAPVLVAVLAALLAMRLYPLALRALLRLSAARRGVAGFVAMAQASRVSPAAALPAFTLVLALGVVAFGGMVRDAVQRGQAAASWQETGADAVIDDSASPAGVSLAAQRAIAAVPGVQHLAAVTSLPGTLSSGAGVEVLAVDPASYAALVRSTPWPPIPAAALPPRAGPGGQIPAVAATTVAAGFRAGQVELPLGAADTLHVRVTATVPATPALPGQDMFLIVPSWALSRLASPSQVLVTGSLDQQALMAAVHRTLPHAVITFRTAALAALADSPLQRGTDTDFGLGIATAAGYCAVVVLLGLAVEARERELLQARLTAMGLGTGQARRMAVFEGLPATLAAVGAGVACGWALAPLTGPALDLSVFTAGNASVPVRADPVVLAIPAAGLVLLALVVLAIHATAARGRGVARALRASYHAPGR